MEEVVLVDWDDREVGCAPKLVAHQAGGLLHRAVSVLVFDRKGRMLIQKRAAEKYHAPGQWANACCSHPRSGEKPAGAAQRRLKEELGIECELREAFTFTYSVPVGNGLTERELDHVFVGRFEGDLAPNPTEVETTKWISMTELYRKVSLDSKEFAPWFKMILIELAHSEDISVPGPTR